ncbi:MAG: hypothetical protein VSS75_025780 [Candidatus Parabeggiatoa sp.]|nr:hypothetical protein [Candidatus Parabeggiatoa sp.]
MRFISRNVRVGKINRYFTAKRRLAAQIYKRFRRDAMLRVSNYK